MSGVVSARPENISNLEIVWCDDDMTTVSAPGRAASDVASAPSAETALELFLTTSAQRAAKATPDLARAWSEVARQTRGGKCLRPRLVLTAAGAYRVEAHDEGPASTALDTVAAAFELLHTALVIHDDIIDRDDVRRDEPTLHAAAAQRALAAGLEARAAEHHGHSIGLIAGDLALSGAHRMVASAGLDPRTALRLVEIIDDALVASVAGELLDVEHALPGAAPDRAAVLTATRLKTAVYSFEAPLHAGGLLGGAPARDLEALIEVGRLMGLAYQLTDDLLGVFGTTDTGKPTDGDLREGKRTMLVAAAMETAVAEELGALIGRDLGASEAARARQLLETCGARAEVEALARSAADSARHRLQASELPPVLRRRLHGFIGQSVERTR